MLALEKNIRAQESVRPFLGYELGEANLWVEKKSADTSAWIIDGLRPTMGMIFEQWQDSETGFRFEWRPAIRFNSYFMQNDGIKDGETIYNSNYSLLDYYAWSMDLRMVYEDHPDTRRGLQLYAGPVFAYGLLSGRVFLTRGSDRTPKCVTETYENYNKDINQSACERVNFSSIQTLATMQIGAAWLFYWGEFGVKYRTPFRWETANFRLKQSESPVLYLESPQFAEFVIETFGPIFRDFFEFP